jgi:hypothetical protein
MNEEHLKPAAFDSEEKEARAMQRHGIYLATMREKAMGEG